MPSPACKDISVNRTTVRDLDGDGKPEELVEFDRRDPISTIGLDCFYEIMGEDNSCPASDYANRDGLYFLKLSSGKFLAELDCMPHFYRFPDLCRGQRVMFSYPLRPIQTGIIESFSNDIDTIKFPSSGITPLWHVNVRLDDGTLRKNVHVDVIQADTQLDRLKRGILRFFDLFI